MNTAHTPSPWQVRKDANGIGVSTPSNRLIAAVYPGEADAALIAAAPDLLAALEKCVAAYNLYNERDGRSSADTQLTAAADNAIDAIRKATGKA